MPANHLFVHVRGDVVDGEPARVRRDLALQHHLQKDVAELFPQMHGIVGLDGVHGLVSFLDHVMSDGGMRLLAIPWAAVGSAQGGNRGDELVERRMILRAGIALACLGVLGFVVGHRETPSRRMSELERTGRMERARGGLDRRGRTARGGRGRRGRNARTKRAGNRRLAGRNAAAPLPYLARSSQNATALAAATFRLSTPCFMGMRTV